MRWKAAWFRRVTLPPLLGLAIATAPGWLIAQDSVPPLDQEGVRVGITYTPGLRPGMLVLGGTRDQRLDSVRAIIQRDLDYSDRFEIVRLPGGDSLTVGLAAPGPDSGIGAAGSATTEAEATFVNYPLFGALGADYAVNVSESLDSALGVTVYDVRGAGIRREVQIGHIPPSGSDFRMRVHRASDEVVRAASGAAGIAATRLLFIQRGRVYRIDSDGAEPAALSPGGGGAMSPTWAPDGRKAVYMEFSEGAGRLYVVDVTAGTRQLLAPTADQLNFSPAFAPDGQTLVFARATGEGTDLYAYNLARDCCLERLTVGRFSDNLTPTHSPDGRRIAFVSTRAGAPQVYVMAADGTGQELFAPFDYGVTGSSNAPEWSPDGLNLAFHREVAGSPQVFVMDVASRRVKQVTSAGRNEDPTWAPDGRHIAFVSSRTGSRQLWVIDLDTGRVRQLTRLGQARLPSWSPRISQP